MTRSAGKPRGDLLGLTLPEIDSLTQQGGFPSFRAKQLFHWLYQKGIESFDEAGNLPKTYREFLSENYLLGQPVVSKVLGDPNATQKILFELCDGKKIEGVLMREKGRVSLCVSTQVGCALDCQFCLTGQGGFQRNLSPAEIIGQVLAARRLVGEGELLNNLVFMGMGEPMLNLKALLRALELILSPQALEFSPRRVTVSTAGHIPGIREFGAAGMGVNLAVSLNATTDVTRTRLMPINKKHPLKELLLACRDFPMSKGRRITFEYVMLRGVNDTDADAKRLVRIAHGISCKMNLIVFNRHESLPFQPSLEDRVEKFRQILHKADLIVAVRHSKGQSLQAACGQLAGHVEKSKDAREETRKKRQRKF